MPLVGAVLLLVAVALGLLFWDRTPTVTFRSFASDDDTSYIRSADVRSPNPPFEQLVAFSQGKVPVLWNAVTGEPIRRLDAEGGACAALAPLDFTLAVTGHDDGSVILWDLAEGKEVRRFTGNKSAVNSVAFSPQEQQIASGGCDNTVRVWDRRTGQQLHCLRGHTGLVTSVVFDATERYALSGSWDGTVRLWDLETATERKRFDGHGSHVLAVALSGDGRHAVSGGRDRTIRVWDIDSGAEVRRIEAHSETVGAVCYLEHDRIAVADGQEVRFLVTTSGKDWLRCAPQPSLVGSVNWTSWQGRRYVVIGTAANGVRVCELP